METPEGKRALLECLCVRRDAGVGVGFRRGEHGEVGVRRLFPRKRAVPETEVTFPGFQIARGWRNDGKRLSGLALECGDRERTRWARHQSAYRDDPRVRSQL